MHPTMAAGHVYTRAYVSLYHRHVPNGGGGGPIDCDSDEPLCADDREFEPDSGAEPRPMELEELQGALGRQTRECDHQ